MSIDPFEAIKVTFFQECEELLGDLESGLLALESGDSDLETINAVFRAVHSVKGGAGAFGMDALVRFAHVFETLMDELRAGRKPCDDVTVKTLLRASDVLADHVAAAKGEAPEVDEARSAGLVVEMEALTRGEVPVVAAVAAVAPAAVVVEEDEFGFKPLAFDLAAFEPLADLPSATQWRVTFRPHGSMYSKANETGLMLRELGRLGETTVSLNDDALPKLDEMSAEDGYLVWTAIVTTEAGEAAVREVFEFVEGECDLTVELVVADAVQDLPDLGLPSLDLPAAAPTDGFDIAALLARAQAEVAPEPVTEAIVAPIPAPQSVTVAVAAEPMTPMAAQVAAAIAAPQSANTLAAAAASVTIRVDLDRVDRLINVVGELVIQQAMLAQRVAESGLVRSSGVSVGLEDLELLTREIQDSVMAIRAQPVKSVFQRMPRLVREVAEMTGKRVRLVTAGEDTEVDKTVVERLAEPITHMLRNAIDHGLEGPEDREAAGKPSEGVVRLAALHRSGRIVIEISDDGRGINRPRVKKIAIERGLIAEDAILTDEETDNLIFMPGFSTADVVSDISGRGVGMDVVKRSIQALGGRISISSNPGKGSTFTLSLPLTLAVLDGMVVTAAEQTLVAPLTAIVESLTPRAQDISYVGGRDAVIRFREQFVPLIDVGMALGFAPQPLDAGTGVAMIVETEGGTRAALLVNAIQGQRQVVIKSLETNYQPVDGVAAATILGDGRVALILDVDALVNRPRRKTPRTDFKLAS